MVPNHNSKEAVAQVPYCFWPKDLFCKESDQTCGQKKLAISLRHSAHVIIGFLAKNNMAFVRQHPYSPDLTSDYSPHPTSDYSPS